jgi:hypothetical protein
MSLAVENTRKERLVRWLFEVVRDAMTTNFSTLDTKPPIIPKKMVFLDCPCSEVADQAWRVIFWLDTRKDSIFTIVKMPISL